LNERDFVVDESGIVGKIHRVRRRDLLLIKRCNRATFALKMNAYRVSFELAGRHRHGQERRVVTCIHATCFRRAERNLDPSRVGGMGKRNTRSPRHRAEASRRVDPQRIGTQLKRLAAAIHSFDERLRCEAGELGDEPRLLGRQSFEHDSFVWTNFTQTLIGRSDVEVRRIHLVGQGSVEPTRG